MDDQLPQIRIRQVTPSHTLTHGRAAAYFDTHLLKLPCSDKREVYSCIHGVQLPKKGNLLSASRTGDSPFLFSSLARALCQLKNKAQTSPVSSSIGKQRRPVQK